MMEEGVPATAGTAAKTAVVARPEEGKKEGAEGVASPWRQNCTT